MAKIGRPRLPVNRLTKAALWKRVQRERPKQNRCTRCGKSVSGKGAVVDHKDGNQRNSSARNLTTLCRACHMSKSRKSGEV